MLKDLDAHQLQNVLKLIKKANPPPMLYRYRSPSEWAIKEIEDHEIHAAGPEDMNNPFEYRAPLDIDPTKLKENMINFYVSEQGCDESIARHEAETSLDQVLKSLKIRIREAYDDCGIVCFSASPSSIRMWSYYGDSHRGICIGYQTDLAPLSLAIGVRYADVDKPLDLMDTLGNDPTILADHISCRKSAEWAFEQEYRLPVGPIKGRSRLFPLHPQSIAEVRLGAKISTEYRAQVMRALDKLPHQPKVIQMVCDFERFVLTEEPYR